MSKTAIANAIAKRYGFSAKKIVLLEVSTSAGVLDYAMFECCGITYQVRPEKGSIEIYD